MAFTLLFRPLFGKSRISATRSNLLPPSPFAASLLQAPNREPAGEQTVALDAEDPRFGVERETGFEPATLSLGKYESGIARVNSTSQLVGNIQIDDDAPFQPTSPEATIRRGFASPLLPDLSASLTVKEVAARLRVRTATVYRLCTRGKLPHFRVGAAIRIREAGLAAYQAR